tara:strand:- start:894 stop:1601 length:708 start_codon:yes stop_codon:yes gene_type:complete
MKMILCKCRLFLNNNKIKNNLRIIIFLSFIYMEIVDNTLNLVFKNKYSSTILTIMLICYASLTRPTLPRLIVVLFENPIFRIFILSLIVYRGNKNPRFSLIVATGFTIIMDLISKKKIFDTFTNVDSAMDTTNIDTNMDDANMDDTNVDNTNVNTPSMDSPAVDDDYIDGNNEPDAADDDGDYDPYVEEEHDEHDDENLKYIVEEENEKCRELPDGTDTCSDDQICDKGKCIDAT